MDFGTIKKKLNLNIYQSVEGFLNDMSQVFINCRLYNGTESPVGRIGVNIRREYDRLLGMYNFVERFQNSQQVHPSVLFIKDLQGKKKEKVEEEVVQKENVEPKKPEGSELEIEKKLPLIPEINANKIVEEPQQITPNEETQKEDSKIVEEVQEPTQSAPIETEEQPNKVQEAQPIQIEESIPAPPTEMDPAPKETVEQNTVPVEKIEPETTLVNPVEPEIVKPEEEKVVNAEEVTPVKEMEVQMEKKAEIKEEVSEKISNTLNTETNAQTTPDQENKIKEASEDSLLNDSIKEAKSPEKAETKAPEILEPKPV